MSQMFQGVVSQDEAKVADVEALSRWFTTSMREQCQSSQLAPIWRARLREEFDITPNPLMPPFNQYFAECLFASLGQEDDPDEVREVSDKLILASRLGCYPASRALCHAYCQEMAKARTILPIAELENRIAHFEKVAFHQLTPGSLLAADFYVAVEEHILSLKENVADDTAIAQYQQLANRARMYGVIHLLLASQLIGLTKRVGADKNAYRWQEPSDDVMTSALNDNVCTLVPKGNWKTAIHNYCQERGVSKQVLKTDAMPLVRAAVSDCQTQVADAQRRMALADGADHAQAMQQQLQ